MRIDQYLVTNNYFESRSKAEREIKAGNVLVNNKVITKTSFLVTDSDLITISDNVMKYVSQGGLKLEGAILDFNLDFKDKIVLDIGASTGGFTDCALAFGAKKVFAVDVGTKQLHVKLLNNSKVISLEQTNILELPNFLEKIDIVVTDVSFISILNILDALLYYIVDDAFGVILIKPQFEAGNIKIKNGVLKDLKIHLKILEHIYDVFSNKGLYINKIAKSKQLGKTGNQEYVCKVSRFKTNKPNFKEIIK